MNNNIHQKKLELHFLHNFIKLNDFFNKGKIITSEAPDFIFMPNKKYSIGIEITQFFTTNASIIQTTEFKLVNKIKQLYFEQTNEHISVLFSFNKNIKNTNTKEIVEIIKKQSNNKSTYKKLDNKTLPSEIKSLIFLQNNDDKCSYWSNCPPKISNKLFYESLENTIAKKEEKYKSYENQRINEHWLIVVIDCIKCYTKLNINNLSKILERNSNFKKIFLFDFFNKKTIEITS
ncbi:MAG: hypothetical protein JXR68_01500 [Bacteroidales bacterium]|nr:hypothetical protein [Bacteroidales bacterium]